MHDISNESDCIAETRHGQSNSTNAAHKVAGKEALSAICSGVVALGMMLRASAAAIWIPQQDLLIDRYRLKLHTHT